MPIVLPIQKEIWLFSVVNVKTTTQLKLICEMFYFENVETLEITPIFQCCSTKFFLHTTMCIGRGQEFENFSK